MAYTPAAPIMSQPKCMQRLFVTVVETPQRIASIFSYHAYSIWLFTYSDLDSILLPQTAFGILHALWYAENSSNNSLVPTRKDVVGRIPLVLYWVWINLLAFNISNQRSWESIAEDAINKPWRTLPSGRWNSKLASYAHKVAYLGALISSWFFGGLKPSIALTILGFWHNDCGGGDRQAFTRNFINSLGFTSFSLGALEVALNRPLNFTVATLIDLRAPNLEQWIFLLAAVVLSTIHVQDMYDQEGDKTRGRNTMPLQIGDTAARWIVIGFMIVWGPVCPLFWRCGLFAYLVSTGIAYIVVFRSFFLRTVNGDRLTYAIWNLWLVSLYALPLERLISMY